MDGELHDWLNQCNKSVSRSERPRYRCLPTCFTVRMLCTTVKRSFCSKTVVFMNYFVLTIPLQHYTVKNKPVVFTLKSQCLSWFILHSLNLNFYINWTSTSSPILLFFNFFLQCNIISAAAFDLLQPLWNKASIFFFQQTLSLYGFYSESLNLTDRIVTLC